MDRKQMNINFLTDLIIAEVVGFIVNEFNVEYDEAMNRFYTSKTFVKLTDSETGLYLNSAAFIYELFKGEMKTGDIPQIDL